MQRQKFLPAKAFVTKSSRTYLTDRWLFEFFLLTYLVEVLVDVMTAVYFTICSHNSGILFHKARRLATYQQAEPQIFEERCFTSQLSSALRSSCVC